LPPNQFPGGPISGSAAPGTVRSLVAADIPGLDTAAITTAVTPFPAAYLKPLVASGASHSAGIAPDPGSLAGTTHYLCEDATWRVPPGGGSGISQLTGDVTTASGTGAQAAFLLGQTNVITPSIAAQQNDWNPTGLATANVVRVTVTAYC